MLGAVFKEQVSTDVYATEMVYAVGILAVMLAIAGLVLIDIGLVRRKNAIDTVVQKLGAGMVAGLGFMPMGYAIWMWQFNQAFGVPNPLGQAIKDWWIGGSLFNELPQFVDPAVSAGHDSLQVFYVFFIVFAMLLGVLLHSVGVERMKPLPLYVLCFVTGAVVMPICLYLVWGPVGPLTLEGVHDHVASLGAYLPVAAMATVVAWRVGPRVGRFGGSVGPDSPGPTSLPLVAAGIALVLAALPFFALGGSFIVPGSGYFGVSMSTSGFGMALMNLFAGIIGGGVGGLLLSYRTRNPYWAIAGPFMGYMSGTTLYDLASPWYMLLVAAGAPIVGMLALKLAQRLRLDEEKAIPLVLAPAVYGALVSGFTEWHERIGGYFGIEEGKYAFQAAEITPWWQAFGVLIVLAIGATVAFVICLVFERLGGLRVTEEEEIAGMDAKYWAAEDEVAAPLGAPLGGAEPAPAGISV